MRPLNKTIPVHLRKGGWNHNSNLSAIKLDKKPRKRLPVGLIVWLKTSGSSRTHHSFDAHCITAHEGGGKYSLARSLGKCIEQTNVAESQLMVMPLDFVLWQGIAALTPEQARSYLPVVNEYHYMPRNAADVLAAVRDLTIQRNRCTQAPQTATSVYLHGCFSYWLTVKQTQGTLPSYAQGWERKIHVAMFFDNGVTPRDLTPEYVLAGREALWAVAQTSVHNILSKRITSHTQAMFSDCKENYKYPSLFGYVRPFQYGNAGAEFRFSVGMRAITERLADHAEKVVAVSHLELGTHAKCATQYRTLRANRRDKGMYVGRYISGLRRSADNKPTSDVGMFDMAVANNLYHYAMPTHDMAAAVRNALIDMAHPQAGFLDIMRLMDGVYVLASRAASVMVYRSPHSGEREHNILVTGRLLTGYYRQITYAGELRTFRASCLHTHEDGTLSPLPPAPVIMGYHHASRMLGKLMGSAPKSPYLGLELEMEVSRDIPESRETVARKFLSVANSAPFSSANRYACAEQDNSLNHGFELVTGYGSLDVHETRLRLLLEDNSWRGVLKSHDTTTCGLHVHICKEGMSLLHAVKLTHFVHDSGNADLIKDVARRYDAGGRYARVRPDKKPVDALKSEILYYKPSTLGVRRKLITTDLSRQLMSQINSDRYELVNFHPQKTVEFRMFKGSMKFTTVMAALEFANALWHFTQQASIVGVSSKSRAGASEKSLTADKFCQWISLPRNRNTTVHLRSMLARKGWDVYQAKRKPLHSSDSAAAA
jgi:hypothetical protein